jgi:MFS family permease
MRRYLEIWRVPGGPLLLIGGFAARLGQGVTVLAWLLLVHETTGSYAQAASISAATSVAIALSAPVAGRLADRFGAHRILPWYGLIYAGTQLCLLGAVLAQGALPWLVLLAALSGVSFPPLSPALRAAWGRLTGPDSGREHTRTVAMATESTLFELIFVIGPLLLAGFLLAADRLAGSVSVEPGVLGPAGALVAAALCSGAGTMVVARGRALRDLPPRSEAPTRGLGPLRVRGVPSLLACAVGVAFSFGGAPVAIAAFAQANDATNGSSHSGILIAVWSLGSAAAGLWYGAQKLRWPLGRQLVVLLTGLAVSYATWPLAPGTTALALLLFVGGAVIAPTLTVQASLLAEVTPESMLNEVYTWLTTTNLSAAALGSATTGAVVDAVGADTGFLVAAVAAGIAAAVALRVATVTRPVLVEVGAA